MSAILLCKEVITVDIRSAESNSGKLLECVKAVADSESTLYGKSRQRLRQISKDCSQIITLISHILQDEALCTDSHEFEPSPSADIQAQVQKLTEEVALLKTFFNVPDSENSGEILSEASDDLSKSAESTDSESVDVNESQCSAKSSTERQMSSTEKRTIVRKYGEVLQKAATFDCGVPQANKCAELLWRWYHYRIHTTYSNAPPFHYGVYRISKVLQALVLVYGYHVEHNSVEEFSQEFQSWAAKLGSDPQSNRLIAPWSVYQVERGTAASDYANLTSVVMWDILSKTSLSELFNGKEFYLSDSSLWDWVNELDPDILDEYVDYTRDPTILQSLNLIDMEV